MSNVGAAAKTPTMKLLVDTAAQRVLFAEAGKDVVDFIFGLVAMPLGAVDRLLAAEGGGSGGGALGCVASVYASVEKMDAAYMQGTSVVPAAYGPYYSTSVPEPPPAAASSLLPGNPVHGAAALPVFLYRCDVCRASRRPRGGGGGSGSAGGFVQGPATYTVMDDLAVTPASAVSGVALLRELGVRDHDALEERTVEVGHREAVGMLRAALHSKTVLTDVFLAKKGDGAGKDKGSTAQ